MRALILSCLLCTIIYHCMEPFCLKTKKRSNGQRCFLTLVNAQFKNALLCMAVSPGRPVPLCGACNMVQVLYSSRCCSPLLPPGRRSIHRMSIEQSEIGNNDSATLHANSISHITLLLIQALQKTKPTHLEGHCQRADCNPPQGLLCLSGPLTANSLKQQTGTCINQIKQTADFSGSI